jgi:hypothetical protein
MTKVKIVLLAASMWTLTYLAITGIDFFKQFAIWLERF